MRPRTLPLLLLLASLAPLRADILLSSGPSDDRAAHITGFVLTAGEPGFTVTRDDEGESLDGNRAELVSVTLTARDSESASGMDESPLYLKIYDSARRERLLACSANALRWDPPAGVAVGQEQTYRFEDTTIPLAAPLWFAFEPARGPHAALGRAGLCLSTANVPAGYALLARDFQKHPAPPPRITLRLCPAGTGRSPWPARLGLATASLLVLGAAGVGLAKRRRSPALPPLPPPPGQDH